MLRIATQGSAATLSDPEIRTSALETIRGLIARVTVLDGPAGLTLQLEGALTAMLRLVQNDQSPGGAGLDVGILDRSVKVVAGARNRRKLPNLRCRS